MHDDFYSPGNFAPLLGANAPLDGTSHEAKMTLCRAHPPSGRYRSDLLSVGANVPLAWKEVWQAGWTMARVFGAVVAIWLLVGLFWPFRLTNWSWGLVLLGCAAITGFWRSWKQSSLLGVLLGVVVIVVLLVAGVSATPGRVVPVPLAALTYAIVYASLSCVIATAVGFYFGRLVLSRRVHGRT